MFLLLCVKCSLPNVSHNNKCSSHSLQAWGGWWSYLVKRALLAISHNVCENFTLPIKSCFWILFMGGVCERERGFDLKADAQQWCSLLFKLSKASHICIFCSRTNIWPASHFSAPQFTICVCFGFSEDALSLSDQSWKWKLVSSLRLLSDCLTSQHRVEKFIGGERLVKKKQHHLVVLQSAGLLQLCAFNTVDEKLFIDRFLKNMRKPARKGTIRLSLLIDWSAWCIIQCWSWYSAP